MTKKRRQKITFHSLLAVIMKRGLEPDRKGKITVTDEMCEEAKALDNMAEALAAANMKH